MVESVSRRFLIVSGVSLVALAACSKPQEKVSGDDGPLRTAPDFGGVKDVYVEADGHGATAQQAIDDAILNAVKQVNGTQVESADLNVNVSVNMSTKGDVSGYSGQALANLVASRTGGIVSNFKIVKPAHEGLSLPFAGDSSGKWSVRIGANVAKYQASADSKRPRVIVATPRTGAAAYELGNGARTSSDVGAMIREQIDVALTQTRRFTVLDTTAAPELDAEADRLASGNVNVADTSRLGQQLGADLLIIPTIEQMGYHRSARQLRMSDRELVSYDGGAAVSFNVVNATTGQLILSERYSTAFPSTAPTTLGAHVDGLGVSAHAVTDMTGQFVSALMRKTFPLSVIKLTGPDAVIGQGGNAVRMGRRYRLVLLGESLKDPQTGQDLGRTESDFGNVVITRVDDNLSYGRIENAPSLSQTFRPGLLELREEMSGLATGPLTVDTGPVPVGRSASTKRPDRHGGERVAAHKAETTEGDQNW